MGTDNEKYFPSSLNTLSLIMPYATSTAAPHKAVAFLMPGKSRIISAIFPVELFSFLRLIADLIHRLGIIQPSVDHDIADGFRVTDIVQGVFVQNDQVSHFTHSQRANVLACPNVFCPIDGSGLQSFHIGHAS